MCFIYQKNLLNLFFLIIFGNILVSKNSGSPYSFNVSEEIKNLFHDNIYKQKGRVSEGFPMTENFAEGGSIKENKPFDLISALLKNNESQFLHKGNKLLKEKIASDQHDSNINNIMTHHDNIKLNVLQSSKFETPTKLSDPGTNLFLGVPEVIHFNGTSSIKPRKGVYYNKTVTPKRVGAENEADCNLLSNSFCFLPNDSKLYYIFNRPDLFCFCCNVNNNNNVTGQLSLLNCTFCTPIVITQELGDTCQHVCCKNDSNFNESSKTKPASFYNTILNKINLTETNKTNSNILIKKGKEQKFDSNYLSAFSDKKELKISQNLTKILKPVITKVPYDIVFAPESSSNFKNGVMLPVIISVFLLPLVGILFFFIWRRTKEFWDKRYYKRMDFLIEGMYNE